MKLNKVISENGGVQQQAIDSNDMADPQIAQLTQKKMNLQKQMAKQIEQIDKQIAQKQLANNKGQTNPQGGIPGL